MKKIIAGIVSAASLFALTGCGTTKEAPLLPYTIHEGDGVIGYYTFEEEIVDNEVVDHSGQEMNVYTGALDGSVLVEGKEGQALQFNGEDEYLTIDSELLSGEGVTIAGWVNPSSWKDWARVFDIGDGSQCDVWCGMDFNTKMLRMDVFGAAGNVTILSPLPPTGQWTHIAATFGNGSAALYVNGKLAQKLPCPVKTADIAATATGIYIGRSNWAADPLFNGAMDNVLVANRVFSDVQIAQLALGAVAPEGPAK